MNRHKEKLVAKGYAQTYGIDYEETYNLVAKMTTVKIIIVMATTIFFFNFFFPFQTNSFYFFGSLDESGWSLHQMDVKNVFPHGDL
jgi:hypothetical protein